ncbi:MAG: alpha/beta fold hydrolase [Bacteroidota bacterium]
MQKLLLLHGALGSEKSLQPLALALQNDFEIHTLTFKGHGGSAIPENDFTMKGFADEVLAYLNQNNIAEISIFGYSMGGYVGLYMAKHFPEKVSKLYTLATKINWTIDGAKKDASMLNSTIIKEKVPKYASALEQLHGSNWENLMQKTAQMMLNLGQNSPLNETDFEQITTPVLLSVGDKDAMVTIEETTNTYRKLPNAQLLVMPNTMHPIERVDVNEVAHQLKKFMKLTSD